MRLDVLSCALAYALCMFPRPQWQHLLQAKDTPTLAWWSCQKPRKASVSTSWEEKSRTRPSTSPASSPEALPTVMVASREETSCSRSTEWYVGGFDERWYPSETGSIAIPFGYRNSFKAVNIGGNSNMCLLFKLLFLSYVCMTAGFNTVWSLCSPTF